MFFCPADLLATCAALRRPAPRRAVPLFPALRHPARRHWPLPLLPPHCKKKARFDAFLSLSSGAGMRGRPSGQAQRGAGGRAEGLCGGTRWGGLARGRARVRARGAEPPAPHSPLQPPSFLFPAPPALLPRPPARPAPLLSPAPRPSFLWPSFTAVIAGPGHSFPRGARGGGGDGGRDFFPREKWII